VIRFSAALVVVAIGVLIGGVATSSLELVYVAIAISVAALIALGVGVALKWGELFGEEANSSQTTGSEASQAALSGDPSGARVPAAAGAAAFRADPKAEPTSDPKAGAPLPPGAPSLGTPAAFRRPSPPPTRADPVLPSTDATTSRATAPKVDHARADEGKAKPAGPRPGSEGGWTYVDDEPDKGNERPASRSVRVVPGVARYHDPECILVRFLPDEDLQQMTAAEAEKAGCTPCSACQSD